MNSNYYVTIMAGGIGSRFWPASTEETPKQFLDILGVGKSLIQLTAERFTDIVPIQRILVLTNQQYKGLVMEHLPDLPEENILCEPSRNNTGPCVAYTALKLFGQNNDAVFITVPSDAMILKVDEFVKKVKLGFQHVESQGGIVTLGIEPTRPETGYGYIEVNKEDKGEVLKVIQFREKPDYPTAKQYLDAGNFYWNAGIFIWKAEELIEAFRKNAPGIISVLSEDVSKYNTSEEQTYIDEVYPNTPNISVDYAILEKSNDVYTIPADIEWSDLGTWNSLHAYLDKDHNDTVNLGENTYLENTSNCFIRTDSNKTVIIKGLQDYVVIDEPGGLLIFPKNDTSGELSNLLKKIKNP